MHSQECINKTQSIFLVNTKILFIDYHEYTIKLLEIMSTGMPGCQHINLQRECAPQARTNGSKIKNDV